MTENGLKLIEGIIDGNPHDFWAEGRVLDLIAEVRRLSGLLQATQDLVKQLCIENYQCRECLQDYERPHKPSCRYGQAIKAT